jgi:desulfoferrodoxin (superoxide reductase-like protein)
MLVISSFSICIISVAPVKAIVPQVQDVVIWNSGGETILNITVYHTPVPTLLHHVDQIEVDVDGSITSFPVDQPSITFTFQANLGQITGTPSARVRAHCNVHGWSPWSEPLQIPEFSSWIILPLSLISTLFVIIIKKKTSYPIVQH